MRKTWHNPVVIFSGTPTVGLRLKNLNVIDLVPYDNYTFTSGAYYRALDPTSNVHVRTLRDFKRDYKEYGV